MTTVLPSASDTASPVASPLATSLRSHTCGALRAEHAGARVTLGGWVHRSRDLGGLVFLDLRDRDGVVQVSFDPSSADDETRRTAAAVGIESVVLVEGEVVLRPAERRNAEMATGEVEVRATAIRVVGAAETPAIPVARGRGEKLPSEDLRLRYRYLDLRRPELQHSLMLRHRLAQRTRRYLSDNGFLELETPILTKPTPEGARDYLVPSRVHAGEFYALPQSPQIYKQLFMVAGFDRYFQIARCFRDEDLRADRQPEFTQIDIEASFVDQDDIIRLAEGLIVELFAENGVEVTAPFRRMTYRDAMEGYGIDRPDLRYDLKLSDVSDVFRGTEFGVAATVLDAGGRFRGLVAPGGARFSRKEQDELQALAKGAGAHGAIFLKRTDGKLEGGPAKFLRPDAADALGLTDGDMAIIVAGPDHVTSPALDRIRQDVARRLGLVRDDALELLWVVDFPMFERDPKTGALAPMHHPFTSPMLDDAHLLDTAPEKARARAYDVVLNGTELGGGSIRISDPTLQAKIFSLLGIDDETARARFGFLLEGLRAGAPPHGGIAFGFDRIAMLWSGAGSLRDVIAFPKTTAARALFEGAPTHVPPEDLQELRLRVEEEGK
ncbi:Aspartyl-tRNA synthetase [Gemmatirosa kalamazoonensis]|uniref:Aspartate--tRNA ligase n=1 Tax=Gemmatirosa kalamazoonensis TaxID=861299 RepID=W0RN69_9BACT|nr:aspartate--tRNA ligase [Gemmatirosa kalamazoonensis]AHG90893.1 Aspartyl-tRNA synthetase [Gemmatirosa kalamazoonensis]